MPVSYIFTIGDGLLLTTKIDKENRCITKTKPAFHLSISVYFGKLQRLLTLKHG